MKVLLLHAFPLDKGMWEPQRATLAGHEVIAPRLYGRGRTIDEWAGSLAGEIKGDLVVVGASMGGYCALALARHAPERVRGLLLVGSRPDADSDERRAGREDTIELIHNEGVEGLWRMMLPKLFHDQSVADEQLVYRDAEALVTALAAVRDREDSTDVVRSFSGPVQFVIGEFDPYVSAAEVSEFDVRELKGVGLSCRPSSTWRGSRTSSARTTSSSATSVARTRMRGDTFPVRDRSFWARRRR